MRHQIERMGRLLARPVLRNGRLLVRDALLLSWFTALTVPMVIRPIANGLAHPLGIDTIVYTHAARALLDGGDPWRTAAFGITFAAPPPSLLPYLPLVWLSDEVLASIGVGAAFGSAVYAIRRLRLPLWWLLFPPVALGIAAGSFALPMLALIVRAGVGAEAAAAVTRLYAVVPLALLGRWRALLLAALAIGITSPLLAWDTFIADRDRIAATVAAQAGEGMSGTAVPLLIPWVVLLLILIGRRRAAWLAVPLLWPNAQLHYASIALPVLAEMPLVAVGLAADSALLGIGSLTAQVLVERFRRGHLPARQQRGSE